MEYEIFGVILQTIAIENSKSVNDEVDVLRDTSCLAGQILDYARLDFVRGDLRIVTSIAVSLRQWTERRVNERRNPFK